MSFLTDTFTDTAGTVLSSHTGELGATWTRLSGDVGATLVIDGTGGRVRLNSADDDAIIAYYYASGVPTSADYDVTGVYASVSPGFAFLFGRLRASAPLHGYSVRVIGADVYLFKAVEGVQTQLATATVSGTTYALHMTGSSLTVDVDGTPTLSATDSAISAAGRAGIALAASPGDDLTGPRWSSVNAADPVIPPTPSADGHAGRSLRRVYEQLASLELDDEEVLAVTRGRLH